MFFKDVIGQDELKQHLTDTVRRGIVPHARLFCGEEGTGAFQLALAYARYLNCENRSDTDSCGRCKSCIQFSAYAHPDLHFVFPMYKAKKKEICDDFLPEWREFLGKHTYFGIETWLSQLGDANKNAIIYSAESESIVHKMTLRIFEAEYRVLFVWMPERMHQACANKLLKLIEEPPDKTAILMVTDNPDAVLGTIVSRSQPLYVRPVKQDILENALTVKMGLQADDARRIAQLSGGNYFKAMELLSVDNDNVIYLELFKSMMRNGWAKNIVAMKQFAEEIHKAGHEKQKGFLAYCQRQIRENYVNCLKEQSLNYMNRDEADFAVNFAKYVNERNVIDLMDELSLADRHISQNVNPKMVFFDLSMRITALIKR